MFDAGTPFTAEYSDTGSIGEPGEAVENLRLPDQPAITVQDDCDAPEWNPELTAHEQQEYERSIAHANRIVNDDWPLTERQHGMISASYDRRTFS